MSVDVLCAMHDCALGFSPVTSYSGVKNSHPGVAMSSPAVDMTFKLFHIDAENKTQQF